MSTEGGCGEVAGLMSWEGTGSGDRWLPTNEAALLGLILLLPDPLRLTVCVWRVEIQGTAVLSFVLPVTGAAHTFADGVTC